MVIDDANLVSLALRPAKDDPPLDVHSDTVKPAPLPPKQFETIARRRAEIKKRLCGVQGIELPERRRKYVLRKLADATRRATVVHISRSEVPERGNHNSRILVITWIPCNHVSLAV
jgi:hypothetical protein